ncbi:MAG: trypsin-like peptidase domain-containing protein [Planctomycetes bacterium]|nr:trypsin-like peptidase domain-containing protein [Planctomycetota bacterium]
MLLATLALLAPSGAFLLQQGIPADPRDRLARRVTPEVEVVQACKPAVVFIQTNGKRPIGRDWFGQLVNQEFSGMGSGVVVKKQGFVITNYHVVKNAQTITVSFAADVDDQTYPAELVSFVAEEDLALLKIQTSKPGQEFPTVPLGTSADLMLGERVIAIGNPYGQTHTVSQGMISGLHRNVPIASEGLQFDDLLQTDASINPGNSGGPLLNINGELIGINSAVDQRAQNIGFAIPVDRVKAVMQYRLTSPEAARTWLGFEVENLQVSRIVPGSPAEEAGLKPGDCIVALNGQKVATNEDYRLARIALPPREKNGAAARVNLRFERSGKARDAVLTPWEANEGMIFQRMGLRCEDVRSYYGTAVRVLGVQEGGPAAQLGLEVGDQFTAVRVLTTTAGRGGNVTPAYRIRSKDDLAELLTPLTVGTKLEVEIFRDLNGDDRFQRDELHRGTLAVE